MTDKAKILFVDDEKQILVSLRALFRSQYQVLTADNGDAALDLIRREPIHVIVSDQRMPQMLGHELLREVKKLSPSTMRLLLTGYSDLNAIVHSINDGEVFRFINKPWDNSELRNTVADAVQIALSTMDTAALLADDASSGEASREAKAGILVLDDLPEVATKVQALFQGERPVYSAQSVDKGLDLLEREEIAVLITDVSLHGEDTTDFVKLLKQQYPLIMTIVLTEAFDSSAAIHLINQGKIYRYLRKPIADAMLQSSIRHGLRFYQTNKENPTLLQRQKVEAVEVVRNPSLAQRMMGRLKSLRARFRLSW